MSSSQEITPNEHNQSEASVVREVNDEELNDRTQEQESVSDVEREVEREVEGVSVVVVADETEPVRTVPHEAVSQGDDVGLRDEIRDEQTPSEGDQDELEEGPGGAGGRGGTTLTAPRLCVQRPTIVGKKDNPVNLAPSHQKYKYLSPDDARVNQSQSETLPKLSKDDEEVLKKMNRERYGREVSRMTKIMSFWSSVADNAAVSWSSSGDERPLTKAETGLKKTTTCGPLTCNKAALILATLLVLVAAIVSLAVVVVVLRISSRA